VLLVAGTSLVDEAPLAALAARQVARRGGAVFVLAPFERYLGDVAHVTPAHPAHLAGLLADIQAKLGATGGDGSGHTGAAGAIARSCSTTCPGPSTMRPASSCRPRSRTRPRAPTSTAPAARRPSPPRGGRGCRCATGSTGLRSRASIASRRRSATCARRGRCS